MKSTTVLHHIDIYIYIKHQLHPFVTNVIYYNTFFGCVEPSLVLCKGYKNYNVKCPPFIRLNFHCSSAQSPSTMMHLSNFGLSLKTPCHCRNQAFALAAIHEWSFPFPHYCGIGGIIIVTLVAKQMICEEMWSCSMTVEPHSMQGRHECFGYFTGTFCTKQPRIQPVK